MKDLRQSVLIIPIAFTLISFSGCSTIQHKSSSEKNPQSTVIVSIYTEKPVVVDGILDDAVWNKAPVYNFSISRQYLLPLEKRNDRRPNADRLNEKGEVKLAWDENFLYIGAKLYDSDIVQENDEDQKHHYSTGDVLEIFLKPEKSTWYWEIYGTPNGKKTVFWFPARARVGLPSTNKPGMELESILVGARIKGTLNNWQDRDEYWTVEIAIPVKELTKLGDEFGMDGCWRILIGRYNYSRYNPWVELSTVPQISITHFHLFEEYGLLQFKK